MIFSKNFTLFLSAFFILFCGQHVMAMENPLLKEVEVAELDHTRDMQDIIEIFRSDWHRLEASRPFDQKLIECLLEPWKGDSNITKWMKVLRHNQKTIGFVTYYYRTLEKQGSFEVGGLAPAYRGKGLAKYFFPLIIEELKKMGATEIALFVKKDNIPARSLYEKFGFGNPQDAFKGTAVYLTKKI